MAIIVENTEKNNSVQERKFQNLINQLQQEDDLRKSLLLSLSDKVSSISGKQLPFINETFKYENTEPIKERAIIDTLLLYLDKIKSDNIWIENIVSNLDDLI